MDPMVSSAARYCVTDSNATCDTSDNAELLDFCFLCSRQFFRQNLDDYGTERLKDEDVLETFFEELGPVDRSLLQCCPACKALCQTLLRTKEALSSLLDEITRLLLRSRKVSFLLSKSRVVSRLFQSSNSSLPPCESSSSYLQQSLSQMNFPKDSSTPTIPTQIHFPTPTQFDLRLDASNLSMGDLDLALTTHSTPISVIKRSPLSSKSKKSQETNDDTITSPLLDIPTSNSSFSSIYNENITMNSFSDNACDISEGVIRKSTNRFLLPISTSSSKTSSFPDRPQKGWKRPAQDVSRKLAFENDNNDDTPQEENIVQDGIHVGDNVEDCEIQETAINKDHISTPLSSTSKTPKVSVSTPENKKLAFTTNKPDSGAFPYTGSLAKPPFRKEVSTGNKKPTKYQCHPCNKSFQNARNLRNHISAHNQERKYICEICGVSYRRKVDLEGHVSIHQGDSKFKCSICEKVFTQNSGLKRHLRIHSRKFQFKCESCGKQFIHHTSFKAHKLSHEGIREFECEYCDLKFFQNSHLLRHLKVHTGEKPHKCNLCDRSFTEKYNLQVHLKSHEDNPKNLFKCPKCFKSFTRKFKLKQHMNKIHCSYTL